MLCDVALVLNHGLLWGVGENRPGGVELCP